MVINFAAGPAKLPEEVMQEIQANFINYEGTGISVMEMSHRSPNYMNLHKNCIKTLKEILNVPDNYHILLMPGGGTGSFAAVCLNLMGRTGTADYAITGSWSSKAAKEAAQYGKVNLVFPKMNKFTNIPSEDEWNLDSNASFLYYCENETVEGVEFNFIPKTKNNVPLVCDMSSNFLSRPFDVSKFGIIFAGAQKNFGPAGITVVIVRDDLIGHQMKITPSILDFSVWVKNEAIYNTPPTFIIYTITKVFEWIKRQGGLKKMSENANVRSSLVYDIISSSNGFYSCAVAKDCQSRMNVSFRIGSAEGNENLEKEFLKAAEAKGMIQLKGHRSVGGIRASLYNAITIKEAETLAEFMKEFEKNNSTKK